MTLDGAIKHCEEVAEKQEEIAIYTPIEMLNSGVDIEKCQECAEEHRQLAEWLKDYKRLLEQEPMFDKIRSEIEHLTIIEGGEDYTRKMAELYSLKIKVLQIIDKYRKGAAGIEKDYQTATDGEVFGTDPNRGRNERIYHSSDKGAGSIFGEIGTKTGA